jgi:rhodanese-related sulfurtransferase
MLIPLSELRQRFSEISRDKPVWVYCGVGQRAYYATRFLVQQGYEAANLSGGFTTYQALSAAGVIP